MSYLGSKTNLMLTYLRENNSVMLTFSEEDILPIL